MEKEKAAEKRNHFRFILFDRRILVEKPLKILTNLKLIISLDKLQLS